MSLAFNWRLRCLRFSIRPCLDRDCVRVKRVAKASPSFSHHNLSCRLLKFLVLRISFLYLCFFIFSLLCLFTLIA